MNFDQVRQDMESSGAPASNSPSEGSHQPQQHSSDRAPEVSHSSSSQPPTNQESGNFQSQNLTDLEKLEKFVFKGKEWTPKEIEAAMLRQEDYTRKTQEAAKIRKDFEKQQAQEEQFRTSYRYDLQKVRENPALADEFRRIYPDHYHHFVDNLLEESRATASNQTQASSQTGQQPAGVPTEVLKRIEKIEGDLTKREVEALQAQLDSQWETFSKKYPNANQELALARAHVLLDRGTQLSEDQVENLFKSLHDTEVAREKQMREAWIKEQKTANTQGRDIGRGGGTPGKAPEKMSFKGARDSMMDHLRRQ